MGMTHHWKLICKIDDKVVRPSELGQETLDKISQDIKNGFSQGVFAIPKNFKKEKRV